MSRWFRVYEEVLDDPKVQRLDGETFKTWVNMLALASRNHGKLPPVSDIAFALRMDENAVSTVLERLLNGGLIESRNGGANGKHYAPYKWEERQYKSDTSTNRVKRFRERSKNVTETPPETESETDSSVDKSTAGQPAANGHDPVKELFDLGVSILVDGGCSEKQARSLIGKWRKAKSDAEVLQGLLDCRAQAISDPVEWLTKRFKAARWVSKSGFEYRGTDEQVLRECERRGDNDTYWSVKASMGREQEARQ